MSQITAPTPDLAATRIAADMARAGELTVSHLSHAYGGKMAVNDVNFTVPAGEVAALLGPSGCGKSTVLRAIAGLIRPDRGAIALGGGDLTRLPARARGIGMVFQNYALFPHLTVAENIAYPLACQRVRRAERQARVAQLLATMRLEGFGARLPRVLSGGQQQRVAVARALAARPSLLLLDEPFGALDRALRFDVQVEMLRLQRALGITTLLVTHDQEEAQSLASRLILMNRGRVEQIDTPTAIYDRPRTLFVNSFIGSASQLAGTVVTSGPDRGVIRVGDGTSLALPRSLPFVAGSPVVVTCRPEHVTLAGGPGPNRLAARLIVSIPLGPTLVHDLQLADGTSVRVSEPRATRHAPARPETLVHVEVDMERAHVFPDPTKGPLP
jgi:putative spermidine/putrescine transport system ATP-binding protein